MKIKAVLFDFDGTIVDSLGMAMQSFNYALDQVGLPPREPEVIKKYFGSSADKIISQVLRDHGFGEYEKAFQIYLNHQKELAVKTRLYSHMNEILSELNQRQIPMGVVTGRHRLDLQIVMEPHAIRHFFSTIITDDMLSAPKPNPEGILKATEILNLLPHETLYIGDSTVDMRAAKSAGALAVAALWDGLANQVDMLNAGADCTMQTPQDFLHFIRQNMSVSN